VILNKNERAIDGHKEHSKKIEGELGKKRGGVRPWKSSH